MRKRVYLYTPSADSTKERDYELVYASLKGDQSAWETIYLESFSYVVNTARRFDCHQRFSQDDYLDIADEAFCKCYEHLSRYQGTGRFRSWVFGYAKNIMRSRLQRRLTIQKNQYLLEIISARPNDPLTLLMKEERDQFLRAAFDLLDQLDQEIVCRRVFFNTSFRTLARKFQLTRRQVLQHYENSMAAMRWNFCRLYSSSSDG